MTDIFANNLSQRSVQFSRSAVSNSLRPHGLQHSRLSCPSPTPRACSNSCPSSLVKPSNNLILSSPSPPAFILSQHHWLFSSESVLLISWPKYWSFGCSISPFDEYSGLISLRMDWFDLLALQGTLKSLLQHHSSKALIFWHSAFFMDQLSHLYVTTGKP